MTSRTLQAPPAASAKASNVDETPELKPKAKPAAPKKMPKEEPLPPTWTQSELVDLMKRKYQLRKRDVDLFIENASSQINSSEHMTTVYKNEILSLRAHMQRNKMIRAQQKRLQLQQKNQKEKNRGLGSKTLEEIMHDRNRRNLLEYEYKKRVQKVVALLEDYNRMDDIRNNKELARIKQKIRELENACGLAKMRHEEVAHINHQYKSIIAQMRKEEVIFPRELSAMEKMVLQYEREVEKIAKMRNTAVAARDESRDEMNEIDLDSSLARQLRETEMNDIKIAIQKQENQRLDRRNIRAQMLLDEEQQHDNELREKRKVNQSVIVGYEEYLQHITEATNNNNVEEMVVSFMQQERMNELLRQKIDNLYAIRKVEKAEMRQVQDDLDEVVYSGNQREQLIFHMLQESNDNYAHQMQTSTETQDYLNKFGVVMNAARNAAVALKDKLRTVPLDKNSELLLKGQLEAQWTGIDLKLEKLHKAMGITLQIAGKLHLKEPFNLSSLLAYLDKREKGKRKRITFTDVLTEEEENISEFEFENSAAPTRVDIKTRSFKIIDYKTKAIKKTLESN